VIPNHIVALTHFGECLVPPKIIIANGRKQQHIHWYSGKEKKEK